jgi:hypothetical protein
MNNKQSMDVADSPMLAFNNIISNLSSKLLSIYNIQEQEREIFIDSLVFDDNSITILNSARVYLDNGDLRYRFNGSYDRDMLEGFVLKTITNAHDIEHILHHYMYVLDRMKDVDVSIDNQFVRDLINMMSREEVPPYPVLLPYKIKIEKLYDTSDRLTDIIYNRYSYFIKFRAGNGNKGSIEYTLIKCISSELDPSKSMLNVRYDEIEILKQGYFNKTGASKFIGDLFFYGEIDEN